MHTKAPSAIMLIRLMLGTVLGTRVLAKIPERWFTAFSLRSWRWAAQWRFAGIVNE